MQLLQTLTCLLAIVTLTACYLGPEASNGSLSWSNACDFKEQELNGGKVKATLDAGKLSITRVNDDGVMPDYTLGSDARPWMATDCPATITSIEIGEGVTYIGSYSFRTLDKVTSVKISGTVKKIGFAAFAKTGITTIEIPDSVTEILPGCFMDCKSLETVTYKGKAAIEGRIFDGCDKLKVSGINVESDYPSVTFGGFSICAVDGSSDSFTYRLNKGETILTLGGAAMPNRGETDKAPWDKCRTVITEVQMEDAVTTISPFAFKDHTALKSVTFSKNLKVIPDSALDGCSKLTVIVHINSITEIGKYAFRNCEKFAGEISLPASVTKISDGAFEGCVGMTHIDFRNGASDSSQPAVSSLSTLGPNVFKGCSNLEYVDFPQSLTTIGASSFEGTAVAKVVLPDSVTSIGKDCFRGCKSLTEVEYLGKTEIKEDIFGDVSPKVTVPEDYQGTVFGGKAVSDKGPDGTGGSGTGGSGEESSSGNPGPKKNGLTGGAIAGIVIAVVAVITVAVVLAVLGAKGKLCATSAPVVSA